MVMFLPTTSTSTYKPLDLVITHTFKCNYKKEFIQQTVTMTVGKMFEDAAQMKLD